MLPVIVEIAEDDISTGLADILSPRKPFKQNN